MTNVIDLSERYKSFTLNFRCPLAFNVNSENSKQILSIELSSTGEGSAIVKARNLNEAKQEVHKVLPVTEWIE